MADKGQPQPPTHRAYSVVKRDGQDDFWLNLGLAFPHKDGRGFNVALQALPLDGKIVCREIADDEPEQQHPDRQDRNGSRQRRGR